MKDINLFLNHSLQKLYFANYGKDLILEFASSYDGSDLGFIKCSGVEMFYCNMNETVNHLDDEDGFFPRLIHEIACLKLDGYVLLNIDQEITIQVRCLNIDCYKTD